MNWYKKAQVVMEEVKSKNSVDLSSITPQQWKEVNDRMVGLGYDVRGWEDTKKIYERVNKSSGGIQEDHKKVLDSVLGGKDYITKYTPQKIIGVFRKAVNYFGVTHNLKECGYILPNGIMLDLSGKNRGNMGGMGGTRGLDHSEVNDIIPMPEFVSMGAIRHFPEQPGVDIRLKPTQKQLDIISRDVDYSGNGYTVEIIDSRKGRFYNMYDVGVKSSKVINDILRFYR